MDIVKTVKVKSWGKGQGDFVEINESDFDERKHELYEEGNSSGKTALTKDQIIDALSKKGLEFDPKANKADLLALLEAQPA